MRWSTERIFLVVMAAGWMVLILHMISHVSELAVQPHSLTAPHVTSKRTPRGAIVYVVDDNAWDLKQLRASLTSLNKFFKPSNPNCDVVVLYHTLAGSDGVLPHLREGVQDLGTRIVWEDMTSLAVLPSHYDIVMRTQNDSSSASYRQRALNRFLAGPIFQVPALQRYDWMMRLDTMARWNGPVPFDVFAHMRSQGAAFGFISTVKPSDSKGSLHNTVARFLASTGKDVWPYWFEDSVEHPDNFPGFELVNLDVFRSNQFTKLLRFLDLEGGQGLALWRHNTVRTLCLSLFAPKDRMIRLTAPAFRFCVGSSCSQYDLFNYKALLQQDPSIRPSEVFAAYVQHHQAAIEDFVRPTASGRPSTTVPFLVLHTEVVGFANRFMNLASIFFWAIASGRVLLVNWSGSNFSEFLEPRMQWGFEALRNRHPEVFSGIDDTFVFSPTHGPNRKSRLHDAQLPSHLGSKNLRHLWTDEPVISVRTWLWLIEVYSNPHHADLARAIAGSATSGQTAWRALARYLFHPSPPALQLIRKLKTQWNWDSSCVVGIQVRTAYATADRADDAFRNMSDSLCDFWTCAQHLAHEDEFCRENPSRVLYFVAASSGAVLEEAKRSLPRGQVVHTTFPRAHSAHLPKELKKSTQDIFLGVVTDISLLASSRMFVLSFADHPSSLGMLSALLRGQDAKRIQLPWDRRQAQKRGDALCPRLPSFQPCASASTGKEEEDEAEQEEEEEEEEEDQG